MAKCNHLTALSLTELIKRDCIGQFSAVHDGVFDVRLRCNHGSNVRSSRTTKAITCWRENVHSIKSKFLSRRSLVGFTKRLKSVLKVGVCHC